MKRKIELLAPGGDIDSIKAAIVAGADAIYCGLNIFNARNRATNIDFQDLDGLLNLAHRNNCKVFLTLNIIIVGSEIPNLIGLLNKLKAYKLQEEGYDTVEANHKLGFKMDQRDYGIGAQILYEIGVRKMRLLTNNPKKRIGLVGYGLEIVENVPLEIQPNPHNTFYLETKRDKMGHSIMMEPKK